MDFKTASKEELKAEFRRLAAEMGDDQFFTKKELYHLPEVLSDGEPVLGFTSGLMDNNTWLVVLTDRRILFLDKGMLYGLKNWRAFSRRASSTKSNSMQKSGKSYRHSAYTRSVPKLYTTPPERRNGTKGKKVIEYETVSSPSLILVAVFSDPCPRAWWRVGQQWRPS